MYFQRVFISNINFGEIFYCFVNMFLSENNNITEKKTGSERNVAKVSDSNYRRLVSGVYYSLKSQENGSQEYLYE